MDKSDIVFWIIAIIITTVLFKFIVYDSHIQLTKAIDICEEKGLIYGSGRDTVSCYELGDDNEIISTREFYNKCWWGLLKLEKYNVIYSCGCAHEIKEENGLHKPTGKNSYCKEHKKKILIRRKQWLSLEAQYCLRLYGGYGLLYTL